MEEKAISGIRSLPRILTYFALTSGLLVLSPVLLARFFSIEVWTIALHTTVGVLSGTTFDLLRWALVKRNPGLSSSVFLIGTFFRVVLLFCYGIKHMFLGTNTSGFALQAFAASAFAGILFGVAYEATLSICSRKQ